MNEIPLDFNVVPSETSTLTLSVAQGEMIRELISQNTDQRPSFYFKSCGVQPSNAYAYLAGQKPVSIRVLQKLLSGAGYKLECILNISLIKGTGNSANDVNSGKQGELSFFDETEDVEENQHSSFWENDQEALRNLLESPSTENQDEC